MHTWFIHLQRELKGGLNGIQYANRDAKKSHKNDALRFLVVLASVAK